MHLAHTYIGGGDCTSESIERVDLSRLVGGGVK